MLRTVSIISLWPDHPSIYPSICLPSCIYIFFPSLLQDLPLPPSHPLDRAAELFNIRQWGSAAEPEGDAERDTRAGERERGKKGGKDGEGRGSMEVSDAAGSRESAVRERTSGREDVERVYR